METGLLRNYFGHFSMQGERYYFHVEGSMWCEIEPMEGEIKMNIRKLEKNSNFLLGWRGPLEMIFAGVGVGA